MFQCSEQGCKLSANGVVALVQFNMQQGKPSAEALTEAKLKMASPISFGRRGGVFPALRNMLRT